jgi:HSP20 family protein
MLMRFDPFREMDRIAQMADEAARTPRSFPLDVKGERRFARQDGDEVIAAERPLRMFTRQLMLGDALDGERINADYHDGVLTLMIPISERAKPRKVEISTHGRRAVARRRASRARRSWTQAAVALILDEDRSARRNGQDFLRGPALGRNGSCCSSVPFA